MSRHRIAAIALVVVASSLFNGGITSATFAQAPPKVTSPLQEFGHNFGDDYFLATYRQLSAYWQKLDRESDRMVLQSMGKTAEGREQLMAIVTSPENHKNLARYKDISRQLALAEGLPEVQARALAKEGKAVVWIDGGLHATETLGAQQLGEMVYRMVSATDDETMRILRDVIILFVHANPDGNDLVADWYMRNSDPAQRSLANLPRLYQKYIGHDNNRDFFASTQPETENINRVLYREWYPQILYNHHQSGPQGTVLWSPPLRDPFNYNQDPLLVLGIQTIGIALHSRLAAEGKPGATARSGGPYDGWWNGGIRNTAAFHNTIAILTEMIGSPTPMRVPLVMDRQVPNSDLTFPVPPQEWRFRRSVDYSVSCNLAVLDMAAKMGENFLYNRYVMGRNSIARGNQDTWTAAPHRYSRIAAEVRSSPGPGGGGAGVTTGVAGRGGAGAGRGAGGAANETALWAALHRPEDRDPRAYVLPSSQPDFATATRFINALLETGIRVQRATREFSAGGKTYPAGSFVVLTNQAFRPHVIDMFEPQDHPDNFAYPGAPPTRPYDNAGWTLALQMGVVFDRHLEPVTGPFEAVPDWNLAAPAGRVPAAAAPFYALSPVQVDAFTAVNRLLAAGEEVYRSADGSFVVAGKASTLPVLRKVATERGVTATAINAKPAMARRLAVPRVGLWDTYGGSIDAGWARWILEQFEFPFDRLFAPQLDAGSLNAKYDTLVFVDGSIPAPPAPGGGGAGGRGGGGGAGATNLPEEFRNQIGSVTADRTIPQLRAFVEQGGTIVAIGGAATNLARHLGVPIANHLLENGQPLTQQKFYVPGSILGARVDTSQPATAGLTADTNFFFDNSPVWKLGATAQAAGVTPLAWFDSATPLRSGWAWGQEHLRNGVIAVEARIGKGRVLLYGAEILQRAQPHQTFKLLFNAVYDFIYNRQMTRTSLIVASALVAGISAGVAARQAKEPVDTAAIAKIREEGLKRSQTAAMFSVLVDDIGPRLTGSPAHKRSAEWARETIAKWGLSNARLEAFEFGRGWQLEKFTLEMVEPRFMPLLGYVEAWSPSTSGEVIAPVAFVAGKSATEVAALQLKNAAVMQAAPVTNFIASDRVQPAREPEPPAAPPTAGRGNEAGRGGGGGRGGRGAAAAEPGALTVDQAIRAGGTAVLLRPSRGMHGTVFLAGGRDNPQDLLPKIMLAGEHYNMIARMVQRGTPVKVRVNVQTRFLEQDRNSYNVLAEIPGTDPALRNEVVMLGAHLDSWHTAQGATDNADGSVVVMEAFRILKTLGLQPRRTLRLALWSGEEQGLLGARAWVRRHVQGEGGPADREKVSVYFNIDPGKGPIYGWFLENNAEARPIFDAWMAPFADLGYLKNVQRSIGSTDHVAFNGAGVPGFNPIQDYVDYDVREHHTNADTAERIKDEDLKQNAVILASMIYHAANRTAMIPSAIRK